MAMCTTIVSIRDKNIRHLYYGQPLRMLYRTSGDYPNLDQLRLAKKDKELRETILKSAKQNYKPTELEPAPSFRCVSAVEADEISKRLYAGHRTKKDKGDDGKRGEQDQGRTTANKQGNQAVKFKGEGHQEKDKTSPISRRDSTESSHTQQK